MGDATEVTIAAPSCVFNCSV